MKRLIAVFAMIMWFPTVVFGAGDAFDTLLGSYDDVEIRSNYSSDYNSETNNSVGGVTTGLKWQCVEFVRRYYLQIFGIDLRSMHTGNANTWYNNAGKMKLANYPNGSKSRPQVRDILVSSGGPSGHVAIVKSVSDTQVCVVEQNFLNTTRDAAGAAGTHCMNMTGSSSTGYQVAGFSSSYPIHGWLRPFCSGNCQISKVGNFGWYPKGNDCNKAAQWFFLSTENGQTVTVGSATSASCLQACPAN